MVCDRSYWHRIVEQTLHLNSVNTNKLKDDTKAGDATVGLNWTSRTGQLTRDRDGV